MRTSKQIRREIEQAFGFFPPFYEPALPTPLVLDNLWHQTQSAYVENPLSALFKEKLNALLSRYCEAPYCMIVHSAALRPFGMTARQVLDLLETPSLELIFALTLDSLPIPTAEEQAAPVADSALEKALLQCAIAVFLEQANAEECQAELRRLLGPDLYRHLIAYLAYIKTCHTWIEAHPEVSCDADRRAIDNLGPLLADEPALGDFFQHYQERFSVLRISRQALKTAEETLYLAQAQTSRILESITDAFYTLDREWRFTYVNAQAEALLVRTRGELVGQNIWTAFPDAHGSSFSQLLHDAVAEGRAASLEDYYAPLDMWAYVRVYPSPDGLSVFIQNISERKAVEAERERFVQREHAIATQLQEALQPELPGAVPGLALTKYYEAALAEAGVGGDFYDVYALEKGCTALVVGDLSGKGLSAAVQVSTVRNMLRAFLYTQPSLAEALNELNSVLAENDLLSGFSTLFVGAYDSATRHLTYVNCGQEPALVRRASSGSIEQLDHTGLILGSFKDAQYAQESIALFPGDAVVIFTDGLTEVGATRTKMLGVEGVAALLAEPVTDEEAQSAEDLAEALALRLITGVDAFAQTGARDDMCVLVGIVR